MLGLFLSGKEKDDYQRLLALEVNSYLVKIHSALGKKAGYPLLQFKPKEFIIKTASLGSTRMWEFKLNHREEVARGTVGKIVVATSGLDSNFVRKQRALFIACESYVYHAAAHDPSYFKKIKSQNHYLDMLKLLLGKFVPHDRRDHAVHYVIEEIGERKLASYRDDGWITVMSKVKKHDSALSRLLGSSEETFKKIISNQEKVFSHKMLLEEDALIRKEIEDIAHILRLFENHKKSKDKNVQKLVDIHISELSIMLDALKRIHKGFSRWEVSVKEEHELLKREIISMTDLKRMLSAEAEAAKIDINKVHILFDYFKKEKINILRDLALLGDISS